MTDARKESVVGELYLPQGPYRLSGILPHRGHLARSEQFRMKSVFWDQLDNPIAELPNRREPPLLRSLCSPALLP